MLVRDRMSAPVVTITPDMSFHESIRLVGERTVRHLPVVNAEGQIVGVVTERDLLMAANRYMQTPIEVSQIMTREVLTTTPDTPIEEAAQIMAANKIGGLPVVEGQEIVGMITETDLLHALVEMLHTR